MRLFLFQGDATYMPKQNDYNAMLHALMDARVIVLSVLDQIGITSYKEHELREIIRTAALNLVHQKPAIAAAISTSIKRKRKNRSAGKRRRKSSGM